MVEKTVPLEVIIQMEDITDEDRQLAANAVSPLRFAHP